MIAGFCATAIEVAAVLAITLALTSFGSLLSGAGLSFGFALAGFADVWPLALLSAGLGVVVTGFSLSTSIVTGSVAGVLVGMYVVDLVGRLDPSLDRSATSRRSATTGGQSRTASTTLLSWCHRRGRCVRRARGNSVRAARPRFVAGPTPRDVGPPTVARSG